MPDSQPSTVIYLPSSGGHTGSRVVSEVSDFAFWQGDIDDLPTRSVRTAGDFHFAGIVLTRMVA